MTKAPTFSTYAEATEWRQAKEIEYGGKRRFWASEEYAAARPQMVALYKSEGIQPRRHHRVIRSICMHA